MIYIVNLSFSRLEIKNITDYFNNIFVGGVKEDPRKVSGLGAYIDTALPMFVDGNVYLNGAITYKQEKNQLESVEDPNIQMEELENGIYLSMHMDKSIARMKNRVVNTELLGKARIPNQKFENPDGTEITIDTDYSGKKRNIRNPSPGPFRFDSKMQIYLKVWPKE